MDRAECLVMSCGPHGPPGFLGVHSRHVVAAQVRWWSGRPRQHVVLTRSESHAHAQLYSLYRKLESTEAWQKMDIFQASTLNVKCPPFPPVSSLGLLSVEPCLCSPSLGSVFPCCLEPRPPRVRFTYLSDHLSSPLEFLTGVPHRTCLKLRY